MHVENRTICEFFFFRFPYILGIIKMERINFGNGFKGYWDVLTQVY